MLINNKTNYILSIRTPNYTKQELVVQSKQNKSFSFPDDIGAEFISIYNWTSKNLLWSGYVPIKNKFPMTVYPDNGGIAVHYDSKSIPRIDINESYISLTEGNTYIKPMLYIFLFLIIILIAYLYYQKKK